MAQIILSSIATSIMTVVSIVFAILLMTLTLASVFLGTFSYCMAALPAARSLPVAFVPVLTVTGAMLLALVAHRDSSPCLRLPLNASVVTALTRAPQQCWSPTEVCVP